MLSSKLVAQMDKKIDSMSNPVYFNTYMNVIDQRSTKLTKLEKEKRQSDFQSYYDKVKETQSRRRSKATILRNVIDKQLNYSVLFTLKPDKQLKSEKAVKASLTETLSRLQIPYVLVPEYTESGVIHFHGFIRIDNNGLIKLKEYNGKTVTDKYGNLIYEFIPLEKTHGFTQLKDFSQKSDYQRNKVIAYITKYITKTGNKIMSSRYGKYDTLSLAHLFFGSHLVTTNN